MHTRGGHIARIPARASVRPTKKKILFFFSEEKKIFYFVKSLNVAITHAPETRGLYIARDFHMFRLPPARQPKSTSVPV